MTPLQFERWKDFALRMARTCFDDDPPAGHPSTEWIVDAVDNFLWDYVQEDSLDCYVDWDNSDPYPEGHKLYGSDLYGHVRSPSCVGDLMSHWETDGLWYDYVALMSDDDAHWEEIHEEIDTSDWYVENPIREEVVERFSHPVRCCVRAGLDIASAPSAGVVGFTVADLQAMYPEGIPDWVKGEEKWCPAFVLEHDDEECQYFDEMAATQSLVL